MSDHQICIEDNLLISHEDTDYASYLVEKKEKGCYRCKKFFLGGEEDEEGLDGPEVASGEIQSEEISGDSNIPTSTLDKETRRASR